jgi:hypothetical protein
MLPAAAACRLDRTPAVRTDLRPSTVEGPPRTLLVVEVIRLAQTAPGTDPSSIEACLWHVNDAGALYGDHWGWCEDFTILPRDAAGYLLTTTVYAGGTSGGASAMHILPALPASLTAFGLPLRVEADGPATGDRIRLEFAGHTATLPPRQPVTLGRATGVSVDPPPDTGHFNPGGDRPVIADVSYSAVSYGRLDSRRIAGRA